MKILSVLNPEDATEEEIESYQIRLAARAIILDRNHHIAMLHLSTKRYCKLPGGGLENTETEIEALKRECREEAGVEIKIIGEVGKIVEHRKIFKITQKSSCYLAQVQSRKRIPQFTSEEIRDGLRLNWLSYNQIMFCLNMNNATDIEGRDYIVPRDKLFLEKAKKLYSSLLIPSGKNYTCFKK